MKNLLFSGMKHCGKSSVGRAVAEILQRQFVDLDDCLPRQKNESVRQLYQRLGAEEFRRLEAETFLRFAPDQGVVLALGGGVCSNPFLTAGQLREMGNMVYLEVDKDVLFARIAADGIPPTLSQENFYHSFCCQLEERKKDYEALAHVIWHPAVEDPVQVTAEKLVKELYRQGLIV